MVSLIDTARLCHFFKKKIFDNGIVISKFMHTIYIIAHLTCQYFFNYFIFYKFIGDKSDKKIATFICDKIQQTFFFAHWQVPKPWIISALHKDKLQIQTDRHFYALITYALGALSDILDQ